MIVFVIYACKWEKQEVMPEQQKKEYENKSFSVSKDMAKKVAISFSKSKNYVDDVNKNTSRSSRSIPFPGFEDKDISELLVVPDDFGSPILYIINFKPQGYIIVSATIKETPIQGYSTNSNFDLKNLTSGLGSWFLDRVSKIQKIKYDNNIQITTQPLWDAMFPPDPKPDPYDFGGATTPTPQPDDIVGTTTTNSQMTKGVSALLSTTWGQNSGYNKNLPYVCNDTPSRKPPTGCVATALAQVMKYHSYPSSSKIGNVTYYYDWNAMPDYIENQNKFSSKELEIANVMFVVGKLLNMNYTCNNGSSSTIERIPNVLINNFNYSNSVKYDVFNLGLIVNELNNKRPVILRGSATKISFLGIQLYTTDGHAWVCDGWRETFFIAKSYIKTYNPAYNYTTSSSRSTGIFLHMNWGWDGQGMDKNNNNGWFKHDNFHIKVKNIKGKGVDQITYKYDLKMIIGIKPS